MGESRSTILSAVSDWLKLLALVVLVAEAVVLVAMKLTPETNPLYAWYPLFMLLFLCVIVIGIFVDRYLQSTHERNELSIQVGDVALTVGSGDPVAADQSTDTQSKEDIFVDSERGFQFKLPATVGWSQPERLPIGDFLVRVGLLKDNDGFSELYQAMALLPMGRMLAESSCLVVGRGDAIEAVFTEESTNLVIETYLDRVSSLRQQEGEDLSEDEKREMRQNILRRQMPVDSINVWNRFVITTMEKKYALESPVKPTLANLFLQLSRNLGPLDQLVSTDKQILYGSTVTLRNILINNERRELTANTIFHLTESKNYFYLVEIYYSPQTQDSLRVWEELQNMAHSFRMIAREAV